MNVGLIGLGAMGQRMARRLLDGGHDLHVYARRLGAVEPIVAAGAAAHLTAADVGRASDVILTAVTSTADVEEVLLARHGVAEGARPGAVVVDMSTISPAATQRMAAALADRGIAMLDAPVSGGPAGAEKGTLTIMVGGDAEALARVRPVLECLGTTIVHVGGHGAGQTTKACNQLVLLVTAEGVAEALALATRCGLDARLVRQALLGGLAASRVLELFGGRMVERQFEAGIPTRLYHKDVHIGLDLARDAGQPMPAATVVMQQIDEIVARRRADRDLSTLLELLEEGAR